MAEIYEVTGVSRIVIGGTDCWLVRQTRPDGKQHRHAFPTDTLIWRAAEYGIDPADTETLLDMILHEPHMADPGAALAGARTRDTARMAHLAHVTHIRTHVARVTVPAGPSSTDPLDTIRRHRVAPERVREIHAIVNGTTSSAQPAAAAPCHDTNHGTA